MDTKLLTLFADVAASGSFASAARKHDKDPSMVSRSIAALEASLKFQLFKRSTRKLSLTEAGQRYLERVLPVLEELNVAEEEARQINQKPSGLLTITASTAFGQVCLLPHVPAFYETYPDIELNIQLTDNNLDLFTENIDLACRLAPTFQSDLIGIKLFDTRYRVCASPEYLSKHTAITQPHDLSEHKSVVFNLPHYRSRWQFMDASGELDDVRIASRVCVSNALALRRLILEGVGPGLVADWLVHPFLASGELVDIFPDYRVTATDFNTAAYLLYPSRKYLPNKTRVMIDHLKTALQT